MNIRLLTLLVALSLAPAVVYAGNRAWESSIKYTNNSVLTNRVLPVRGNGTTAKGSWDDSHINNKRYLAIKPGKGDWDAETWPDAVIKYCFESDATKEKYFDDLIEARNLWYRANLPEEFGFEPMDDATCRDVAKRGQFLMIHDSQGLATTVGIPVSQAKSTTLKRGPTMNLTDSLEVGLLNRVANYAHEMGVSITKSILKRALLTRVSLDSTHGAYITSTKTRHIGVSPTLKVAELFSARVIGTVRS